MRGHGNSGRVLASLIGMYFQSRKNKVYKGLIAGSIGGLAASWIMTRFQSVLSRAVQGKSNPHEGQGEDATVKTARKISSGVLNHELSPEEKKTAGPLVHYAYGTGIGALYGGLAQKYKTTKAGFGSAYGAAAWALGDEVAVPALGLGKKPTEAPVTQQVQMLAAHVVYGVALEGVRRLTLRVL
jgi:putative membrane protein